MPDTKWSERNALAHGYPDGQDPNGRTICKKLLVIDDEAGVCTVIAHVATSLGLSTRVIWEPLDATTAFVDFAPDMVLLDMIMPGRDGIDLLHEMLALGLPSKFVLMSGYGVSYLRLARGVAAFHGVEQPAVLSKPFRRVALVDLLCATLSIDSASATRRRRREAMPVCERYERAE